MNRLAAGLSKHATSALVEEDRGVGIDTDARAVARILANHPAVGMTAPRALHIPMTPTGRQM